MYENMGSFAEHLNKPPLNVGGHPPIQLSESKAENTASLEAKVNALLMSVGVALMRINNARSTNNSGQLSQLELNYVQLQSRAMSLLNVLHDPASAGYLTSLAVEQAMLTSQLYQNIYNSDKIDLQEAATPSKTPEEIEKAVAIHPMIVSLNVRITQLKELKKQNESLDKDITHTEEGVDVVIKALGASAVVADKKAYIDTLDKIVFEKAEKLKKEDEELKAKGMSEEEIHSEAHIQANQKRLQEHLEHVHKAAKHISEGWKIHQDEAKARIFEVIKEEVEKHQAHFEQTLPEYNENAKVLFGDKAKAWGEKLIGFNAGLKEKLSAMRTMVQNATNATILARDLEAQKPAFYEITHPLHQELGGQHEGIDKELSLAEKQKIALEAVLSGKSNDIRGTAKLMGMSQEALYKEVVKFRADNGINLSVRSSFKDVAEGLNKLFNQGRGTNLPKHEA